MTRICQCRGCGRVRIGTVWTRDATVTVTDMGECPTCGHRRERVTRVRQAREDRALLRGRAKGFGPAPEGSDPFAGFREGE